MVGNALYTRCITFFLCPFKYFVLIHQHFRPRSGFRHFLTTEYLSSGDSSGSFNFPDRREARVLVLGCGNDDLGEAMLNDGWNGGIVNVDFSSIVIQQMREKYDDAFHASLMERLSGARQLRAKNQVGKEDDTSSKGMRFDCHDVTKALPYADGSFDLIICKGTLDAILCSAGPRANARAMMEESCRLLDKDHGVMVTVSYGSKDDRLVYFENPSDEWWRGGVTFHNITKQSVQSPGVDGRGSPYHSHYVIVAKKHGYGGPSGNLDGFINCSHPNSATNDENAFATPNNISGKRLLVGIPEEKNVVV